MELVPSGKLNDRGEEYFLQPDETHVAGNDKFAYVKRDSQWFRSRYLPVNKPIMTNPSTVVKEADPYRQVWNNHGDHYVDELSKVGSAFMPTYLELALRSEITARHHLRQARTLKLSGHHTEAYEAFQEALSHVRISKAMVKKHHEVMVKSH